jgi:DNA polymerase-3 subunit gamma/tau
VAPKPNRDQAPASPAQLRARCSEALRQAPGLRALATAPQLATELAWEPPVLRFSFPGNVRQTLQDFEREKASPHLLAALAGVLPGLKSVEVAFDDTGSPAAQERPEDRLRQEPAFQELLRLSGGEVVEIRREG